MRKFWKDRRGNYGMLFAIMLVPIMGGLAMAVDYHEIGGRRQATLNALDAAGIATARYILCPAQRRRRSSSTPTNFSTNLANAVDPANVRLNVRLPSNQAGGGTLKLSAHLNYDPTSTISSRTCWTAERAAAPTISLSPPAPKSA